MKAIITAGKRKSAVARAVITQGTGVVKINGRLVKFFEPVVARLKLEEPLFLAGEQANSFNIDVHVKGGGTMSQAEAARLAIAKGILGVTKDKKLEKVYLDYDRHLLVADVRRRENRKPNTHGKARAKRQKSYR